MNRFRLSSLRFARNERGAVIVEFALVLPLMLLFLGIVTEVGRMLWAYQVAVAGVRDASRYLGRTVDIESCLGKSNGDTVALSAAELSTAQDMIEKNLAKTRSLFRGSIANLSVSTSQITCRSGTSVVYRTDPAPVVSLVATMDLQVPLAGLFGLFLTVPKEIRTTVWDQTRVFGA